MYYILWDKNLKISTKNRIYKTIVKSLTTYGAEVWDANKQNRNKLLLTKMNYLRRSYRKTGADRVGNEVIRKLTEVMKDIMDKVKTKQQILFGHCNTWIPTVIKVSAYIREFEKNNSAFKTLLFIISTFVHIS